MTTSNETDSRVLRVFISSTFRDMQLEREELVKRVFPQVRRLCEARGVTWGEVDLRWGVTDEQKAEGAVLPICLAEIERTRPYFIGLLGQRYGWVPDEIPAPLVDELGWLVDARDRSVTEMEILHGVLNDPEAAGHAYFYLRDPAWVDALPADERSLYVEDSEAGRTKLEQLKARVRSSDHPVRDYPDPVGLGDQVLADLVALVERLYPDPTPPEPLDRDRSEHAAFATSRFAGFVDRPTLEARLDEHADGAGPPLLVTGESGAGSSALVANWTARRQETRPDEVLIEHYVGANASAADWVSMARRLISELARGHRLDGFDSDGLPADPAALRATLAKALSQADASGTRTILVLDGVDRLTDIDGAPDLVWLPGAPPSGVRIVLTSSGGRPLETALHRQWPTLDVPPLDEDERRTFIATFLGRFSKALDEHHVATLVACPLTGNPLYLRTVLDELRQHGDHFTLGDIIRGLLAASTIDDLFELVLARYERDFERDRPGLVRDAFGALWAARRGLSEAELLDVLGADPGTGDPLPHAVWSPLFLAAEQGLLTRSGLLGFATDHLRKGVEDRYLADPEARQRAHARLAAYFATQPLGDRVVDELPWHQADAGDTDGLARTLGDLAFTELAYRRAHGDLRRLWVRADAAGHRMVDAYRPVVDDPAAHDLPDRPQLVWGVARLLTDTGYPAEALRLNRYLLEAARDHPPGATEGPDGTAKLRGALLNLGAALFLQGDLEEAAPILTEGVALCRAAHDPTMLQMTLGNLALVHRDRGDHDEAAALFAEEEALTRTLGDGFALQATLGNQAQLLRNLGRLDDALAKAQEQEQICRDLADRAGIARAQSGQAAILADRGDITTALTLTVAHGEGCREAGDLRGLAESLINQVVMRSQIGHPDAAVATATEAEALARRLDDPGLLARILVAEAMAVMGSGNWPEVERLAREAELTARQADVLPQVALALGLLGTARREQGDLTGCRAAHTEELRVATATNDPQAIAVAHSNLGTADLAENKLSEALAHYAEAEPTFRRLQTNSTLLPMLANRAQIHHHTGNVAAAAADYADAASCAALLGRAEAAKQWGEAGVQLAYQAGDTVRAEQLWGDLATAYRALGDDAALQRALGERALMMINRAQPPGVVGDPSNVDQALLAAAVPLLDEQDVICRRIGDQVGLAACVGNRAIVLRYQGDLAGALAAVEEQARLAQASNNAQGVLFATANRGELLGLLGRVPEALEALQWARQTAGQYGPQLQPMVHQLDGMIAALQQRN